MRTLDRYVLRNFLSAALVWFVVLMSLRIVVDLFVNMDEFAKRSDFWAMVGDIRAYYSYHSLVYFVELGGIIISASACFTLAMMNRSNELTAMMASGVSLHRVALPLVFCSLVLGALVVVDQELLIPQFAEKLVRDKDDVPGVKQFRVDWAPDSSHSVWYSHEYAVADGKMRSPVIIHRSANMLPSGKVSRETLARVTGTEAWQCTVDGQPGWELAEALLIRTTQSKAPWHRNPNCQRIYTRIGPAEIVKACDPAADISQSDLVGASLPKSGVHDVQYDVRIGGRLELGPVLPRPQGVAAATMPAFREATLHDARFDFRADGEQTLGAFMADQARWKLDEVGQGHWELVGGRFFYPSDLSAADLALRQSSRWMEYLSSAQLNNLIEDRKVNDLRPLLLNKHIRVTTPINNLVMLLLVLPFILSRERNLKASAGLSVAVAGTFIAFTYACQYLNIQPALAAWLPVLVFGPVAVVMFDSVKT